jgi:hypothetical protein
MSEMNDLLRKEKTKNTTVFDTTKKSEYLPQEMVNPYDMQGSIQAPPPVFETEKNVKVKYSPEDMKALGKLTENIEKINIDDINVKDDESVHRYDKKLVEMTRTLKEFDNMSRIFPDFFRELPASRKKIIGEKVTKMRRIYEFCLLNNKRNEEDEVLHYKQTERNALTPPDKPPVDNFGPET